MAVNKPDPTTGAPIFSDNDPPDVKLDPTEAARYAGDVGNRIVRANLSALNAYAYRRKGLLGVALDTASEYLHDGTGWRLWGRGLTDYTPTLTNMTATPANVKAQYVVSQGRVTVFFCITVSAMSANPNMSLPLKASDALFEVLQSQVGYTPAAGSEALGFVKKMNADVAAFHVTQIINGWPYISPVGPSAPALSSWANATLHGSFSYRAAS